MTGEQQTPKAESPPTFGEILINPQAGTTKNEKKKSAPPPKPKKTPKQRKQRKSKEEKKGLSKKKVLLCSLVLILLPAMLFLTYLAAASFLIPYYIQEQLTKQYSQQLGRPVAVTQVDFAPFTFDLHLAGIHIGPKFDRQDEKEPALCRIATLDTRLRPQELLQRKVVFEDVRIKGMQTEVIRRADGSFPDLGLTKKGEAGMVDQALLPNWIQIDGFSLTDSMLALRDATNGQEYHLDEIRFSLPSAAAKPGAPEPALHALVNGNPVQIRGQRQVKADGSSATRLVLQLDDIDPQQLLAWLPGIDTSLRISTNKTTAELELILPDNLQGDSGPVLSGTIHSTGLHLNISARSNKGEVKQSGRLQCTAPSAELVIRAHPFRKQYTIEELTLDSPRLVLANSKGQGGSQLQPLSLWPGQLLDPAALPFELMVQRLTINNGTIQKERGPLWKDLQLELSAYRNRDIPSGEEEQGKEQTALSFSAQQGKTTVRFQGTTTPALDLVGKISLHKLDANLLQPYLGADQKLRLDGGKADLVMQVNPLHKQYTVTELSLDQPQLVFTGSSEKSSGKNTGTSSSKQLPLHPLSLWTGQLLDPASLPFDLMIQRLIINKGTLEKKMGTKNGSLWKNLQLEMTDYSNREKISSTRGQAKKATALSFSAKQGKTTVRFQGTTTPNLGLIGKISLHKLDASLLQPYLGADQKLRLNGGKADLVMQVNPLHKQYTITELTLDQPQLVLTGSTGKDSSKLLPFSVWPGPILDPASLPFDLMIQRLIINKGTLQKKNGSPWKDLQLELTGYRNRETASSAKKATALSFSAQQGKTTVRFKGTTAPDLSLTGKISLDNLDASLLQPYLGGDHALRLSGGKATLNGLLRTAQPTGKGKAMLLEQGTISLQDIVLTRHKKGKNNEKNRVMLTANMAESKGCSINLDSASPSLSCASLLLHQANFSPDAPSFFFFPEKAGSPFPPLGLSVDAVKITDSKARLPLGSKRNGLAIPLTALHLDIKKENLHVQAEVGANGKLTADGSFHQGKGSLKLTVKSLDVTLLNQAFAQLFEKNLAPALHQGLLSLQGKLALPELTFEGDAQLNDLVAKNAQGTALSWKSGKGSEVYAEIQPFFMHIDELILQEPELKLSSPGSTLPTALISLFRKQDNKPVLPSFTVKQCSIQEGSMPGAGNRLGFTAVTGSLVPLAAGTASSFTFSGKVNERPFIAQGRLEQNRAEVDDFTVADLPLDSTAKQFAEQLGLEEKGGIRWAPSAEQKNGGRVHFNGFLPQPDSDFSLLLALLTDNDGKFSLPLSLPATASPAQISTAALKKLRRLHLQAVVSPQAVLEKALPDLTLPQRIAFIVGDRLPDFMDDLENFAPLFARRPHLSLRVRGCYDDSADREYLLRMLQEEEDYRVDLENNRRHEEMGRLLAEEELRQVELLNTDRPIDEDLAPVIEAREDLQPLPSPQVELPTEILPELARQRALVVQEYLIDTLKLPADKIILAEPVPGGPWVDVLLEPNWQQRQQRSETTQASIDEEKE